MLKAKKIRWAISVTACIMLVCGSLAVVVHHKVGNLKHALQQFVDSKTNGQYALYMKGYTLELNPLTITFDNLLLEQQQTGRSSVERVSVPHLLLTVGSWYEFLETNQLEIETLILENPTVELNSQDTAQSKGTQFTQQVVKLYPAIDSLLEGFNVHYLEIKKASIGIKKGQHAEQQLNFIDFLVEDWNTKNLSPNRQLRLSMGSQHLNLTKGTFNFSGFVYDFRKRELRFSNFQYDSQDSVTQSTLHAGGEYILLKKLDYDELFQNQRLVYEKVVLHKPTIEGIFKIKATQKNAVIDEEGITEVLKKTLGELSMDSAIFREANIHLTLLTGNDSIKIDLPNVTVTTDHFKVIENQPVFQVGNIEIAVSQTSVTLQNNVVLTFDKVFINPYKKILINNLELYRGKRENKIASIPSLEISQIDLMKFISKKEIVAGSIEMKDAHFKLDASFFKKRTDTLQAPPVVRLDVKLFTVHNSTVEYDDKTNSFLGRGLEATLGNLKADSIHGYAHNLKNIFLREGRFTNRPNQTTVLLSKFSAHGQTLTAENLDIKSQHLKIAAIRCVAIHQDVMARLLTTDLNRWKSISIQEINVSGDIKKTSGKPKKELAFSMASEKLIVPLISVDLHKGDTSLTTTIKNFSVDHFRHDDQVLIGYDLLTGVASRLVVKSKELEASCHQIKLLLPQRIDIDNVAYKNGNHTIDLSALVVRQVDQLENKFKINSVSIGPTRILQGETAIQLNDVNARKLEVSLEPGKNESLQVQSFVLGSTKFSSVEKIVFSTDSIVANGATVKDGIPHLKSIAVFNPYLNLATPPTEPKPDFTFDPSLLDHFTFYPGRVELAQGKFMDVGVVTGDLRNQNISFQKVSMITTKNDIQVHRLKLIQDQLHCDSVSIRPNEKWFTENKLEESRLTVKLFDLRLENQIIDTVVRHRSLSPGELEIGRMFIHASRDKTLPDGPAIKRPSNLAQLVKLPKVVQVTAVKINDGDIEIEETSDKTGLTGSLSINKVNARIQIERKDEFTAINLTATGKLYDQGTIQLRYVTLEPDIFQLQAKVDALTLTNLNKMVLPTQSVEIKSGELKRYELEMIGGDDRATGESVITYQDLHIEFHKKDDPDKKGGLTRGLLTFVADDVMLKNNKTDARASFEQERIQHKYTFNYWVISSIKGAMEAVFNGR